MELAVATLLLAWGAAPAYAHTPADDPVGEYLAYYIGLAVFCSIWFAFIRGCKRSAIKPHRIGLFHSAMMIGVFAIWGPLDDWASQWASAHMAQHMLFIVVISPLLALSRPLPQISKGAGVRSFWLARLMQRLSQRPMTAGYLHGLTIWFWHLPYFYVLALQDPWVHWLEHLSFIVTGALFWWAVLNGASRNLGLALCALLFTLMHTGILGTILTFAGQPLYGEQYTLEDQQLAGLIMWVVGSFPYFAAAPWISWAAYARLQRRERGEVSSFPLTGASCAVWWPAIRHPIAWCALVTVPPARFSDRVPVVLPPAALPNRPQR